MLKVFNGANVHYLIGGLGITLLISLLAIMISFVCGTVLGIVLYAKVPYFTKTVKVITDLTRALPLLLLIFFAYFALPKLGLGLTPLYAALVAIAFFESAMVAEIIRGGITSVAKGQLEGALATGMTKLQALWYVIIPQAWKSIIPPLISQFISLVKDTSLAMAIVLPELMFRTQVIYGQDPQFMLVLFIAAATIYFVINYSLSLIANWFAKRLA